MASTLPYNVYDNADMPHLAKLFPGPRNISHRRNDSPLWLIGNTHSLTQNNLESDESEALNPTSANRRSSMERNDSDGSDSSVNWKEMERFEIETRTFYLSPYKFENIAINLSYLAVGFALYFSSTPTQYYLVEEMGANSVSMGVLGTLLTLPWSFKVFYGLLSDTVSIFGYRRKPYFYAGWLLYILNNFLLAIIGRPSVLTTIILQFLSTMAFLMADVATDALAVERAKLEGDSEKGTFQSGAYTYRAVGMIIGSVSGACLYNEASWGWGLTIAQIYLINGLFPLIIVIPCTYYLIELASNIPTPPLRKQLINVWNTLKLKAVWRPMIFVYIYNVMQIPNVPWGNFLVDGLKFTNFQLGLIGISSTIMTWLGLVVYKKFLFKSSWRWIYVMTTCLGVLFSVMQLILVYRVNLAIGIPDVVFALGDNTFAAFVQSIQFMPTCIMYTVLCPEGTEGTTYALLTTISNLSGAVANDFGSWVSLIWDTSNASFEAGNFNGLAQLTIFTSCLQLLPILLVRLLPATKEDQEALRAEGIVSFCGGFILALTVFVSLVFTIGLNIHLLVNNT